LRARRLDDRHELVPNAGRNVERVGAIDLRQVRFDILKNR